MNKTYKNESLLFNNFRKGNEPAFAYFFNKYYRHILGFSIQFLHDKEEAQGITQEAFIHLWTNKDKITTLNGIQSFLYTFAKSKCLNLIRHRKVKEKYKNDTLNKKERDLDIEILTSLKFDSLALVELEDLIDKSIDELPHITKQIFVKKRFENKKNKEIAEDMDISLKTVEAHMTKALKILKSKLSFYFPVILIGMYF